MKDHDSVDDEDDEVDEEFDNQQTEENKMWEDEPMSSSLSSVHHRSQLTRNGVGSGVKQLVDLDLREHQSSRRSQRSTTGDDGRGDCAGDIRGDKRDDDDIGLQLDEYDGDEGEGYDVDVGGNHRGSGGHDGTVKGTNEQFKNLKVNISKSNIEASFSNSTKMGVKMKNETADQLYTDRPGDDGRRGLTSGSSSSSSSSSAIRFRGGGRDEVVEFWEDKVGEALEYHSASPPSTPLSPSSSNQQDKSNRNLDKKETKGGGGGDHGDRGERDERVGPERRVTSLWGGHQSERGKDRGGDVRQRPPSTSSPLSNPTPISGNEPRLDLKEFQELFEFDFMKLWNGLNRALSESSQSKPIESSVVDKAERKEMNFTDGHREIFFKNGLRKILIPNKKWSIVFFPNGDIKATTPNSIMLYHYKEADVLQATLPNKKQFNRFPTGQTECQLPNGRVLIHYPNETMKAIEVDGTHIIRYPDGSQRQFSAECID
eukprot:GHVN01051447.1.p1 GENE.GHVN01051447.1~~GHVN01051447.1.p1  ORF type:complete len:500 (+),score=155.20 GHVN01051447.1:43-1500(+)